MNKSQGLRLKASHSMDATVGKDLLYTIVSSGKHTCFSHGMCMDCGCAWTLHCSSVWRGRRAPTWFRLEAQRCASLAWALSVSCLPVLSSTVTLPSPICLMNRRNYTHNTQTTTTTTTTTHCRLHYSYWTTQQCVTETHVYENIYELQDSYIANVQQNKHTSHTSTTEMLNGS